MTTRIDLTKMPIVAKPEDGPVDAGALAMVNRAMGHTVDDAEPFRVRPVLKFHIDPGHGWLEVPLALVIAAGLTAESFSRYSYRDRDGDTLYLEEDCDAAKFDTAYRQTVGQFTHTAVHHDKPGDPECFIRSLPRIR
jgi:hypothetical protein|tara:strand:+ start:1188 stop:1598 length:411 start_codon:yes stop_codon:yes gene_type:complete